MYDFIGWRREKAVRQQENFSPSNHGSAIKGCFLIVSGDDLA
jgi:hypothetical protein